MSVAAPTPEPAPELSQLETPEPEEEPIPEGTPICPCCGVSMDPTEYQEIKLKIEAKYGLQILTLLFPEEAST
jgi:hypothetical protein